MTKPPVIIHKLPNINVNLINDDAINGNEIITYDQEYEWHGELTVKLSMVFTRHLPSETIFSI